MKKFLKQEKYQINYEELELQLLSHPSFPSLHSVTGVLDHFNIENVALEVPTNMEILTQLPESFISLVSAQKHYVIVNKKRDAVELIYGNGDKKKLTNAEFLEEWSGILVAVEKVNTHATGNQSEANTGIYTLYGLTAVLALGVFFFNASSLFQVLHFFLTVAGLVISALIVRHELGFKSKIIDKLCTGKETASCESVLNSKGASLYKNVKLSDLGFVYFAMTFLTWFSGVFFSNTPYVIVALTLFSLPITIYSIYYQWRIVKQWCPLCLGIVGVLWLQGASLFFYENPISTYQFQVGELFFFALSIFVAISFWTFVKPLLENRQELKKNKIVHYKFIRNFELFYTLYNKEKAKTTISQDTAKKEIVLGNEDALVDLTLVTNPACFYCKEAHMDMEKILEKDAKNVRLTIRFNISTQDKENKAYLVASRLLEIYHSQSSETCTMALHEVYEENADLEKWLEKWGKTTVTSFDALLEQQKNWCAENDLNFTPALLLNNKIYPKIYDRSDVGYFIEDLMEQASEPIEEVIAENQ
ncbi:vitamin K epoxide reductase family protein [Spongiimicrobium salis]|uniref:vitamin K epoxide reductase family protein n=1 Tax=Spongiimicrobium salis TaxID=1667022 RepID=UPI00374D7B3C